VNTILISRLASQPPSVLGQQNPSGLNSVQSNKNDEFDDVTSIVPYSKGFICSCSKSKGFLYEKIDDKEHFRKVRELKIPPDTNSADPSKAEEQIILSMAISPSEETLLAVTNFQQIYQLVFSNIDVGKVIFEKITSNKVHSRKQCLYFLFTSSSG
jgi:hypothetical protein